MSTNEIYRYTSDNIKVRPNKSTLFSDLIKSHPLRLHDVNNLSQNSNDSRETAKVHSGIPNPTHKDERKVKKLDREREIDKIIKEPQLTNEENEKEINKRKNNETKHEAKIYTKNSPEIKYKTKHNVKDKIEKNPSPEIKPKYKRHHHHHHCITHKHNHNKHQHAHHPLCKNHRCPAQGTASVNFNKRDQILTFDPTVDSVHVPKKQRKGVFSSICFTSKKDSSRSEHGKNVLCYCGNSAFSISSGLLIAGYSLLVRFFIYGIML